MIFKHFAVPVEYQRRVLLYGILGAIILRFIMIATGVWLVTQFHWILYVFGLFLVYTGIKMGLEKKETAKLEDNPLLKSLPKLFNITKTYHQALFFVKQNGVFYATPLFLVLICIEGSDVVFALDSIPAIFSVTQDAFIIFTSNIFAILGLRAFYFLIANLAEKFHYIQLGVAIILCFVGLKMLLAYWYTLPITITLAVMVSILALSMLASIFHRS